MENIDFEVNRENAKELDQFYTNPNVAKRFVDKINELYNFNNYDAVIEPSMGEGFIYRFLPEDKRIGLDIQKNHPDCLEGDFFGWSPEKSNLVSNPLLFETPKIMFVGNPPFGRMNSLACDFFNHAAKYADVICFIIPRTWMKFSVQKRLNSDFGLYFNAVLPQDSFIFKGSKYKVGCVAQCWSRFDPRPDLDIVANEDWQYMDLMCDELK